MEHSETPAVFFAAPEVPETLPVIGTSLLKNKFQTEKALSSANTPALPILPIFRHIRIPYAPVSYLEQIFMEAIQEPDVKVLSIATRPDCLSDDILDLLNCLNQIKPVWIELGLQTIHEKSVEFIRRGYPLSMFERAVTQLHHIGIPVIVHTILCLPNETKQMMLDTISYLNRLPIQGIKLQLLHILKHTDLAKYYEQSPFWLPSLEEYLELLGVLISHLRPDIVVHRLTGDGPKNLLIAPKWTANKRLVLNSIQKYFKDTDIWQGKDYLSHA